MSKKIKQNYFKVVDKINSKNMGILVSVLFVISLIPVLYVGLHNYASGDDYWYGVHTYQGWITDGIIGALKGSIQMVIEFYYNWQGTWFTMFLFTLSPHHFAENGYIITIFISLGLLIGSFAYLAHYYLIKRLSFTKGATAVIVCLISYLAIQYIPRTTSGLYWFNGIMHYSVPFFLAVLAVIHSHKFIEYKRKKDYIILFISFLLLGGGSYLAPLAATLTVVLIMVVQLEIKELDLKNKKLQFKYDWRNLWILLAFLVELIGLAISFMAPGNSVRGGEEFGADLKWALQCIYYAIDRGIYLGEDFFLKNAVTTVVYIILAIIIWEQLWRSGKEKMKFRFPLLFVIYMNGVYWATYTPEIYSRSDVSGGVRNTYFHIFLIVTFVNMIYVHGWLQEILTKYWEKKAVLKECSFESIRDKSVFYGKNYKVVIEIPAVVLSCILLIYVASISEVITTNEYCVECISNGSLERYLEVRREQHEILSTSEEKNVTVPEMEAPYPLLHMLMSDSEMGGQNINRAKYYNKDSIKAELIRDN